MASKQPRKQAEPVSVGQQTLEQLRSIADSLDLLSKIAVDAIKGERSQRDMIIYLDGLGVSPKRIAELLHTTQNTVNPTLSRERKKTAGKSGRDGDAPAVGS